jgi:hypothetical protein
MRSIGLDVHQSFCEVVIHEAGETRSAGRIRTDREELELFAQSLDPTDQVAWRPPGRRLRSPGSLLPTSPASWSQTPRRCGRSPTLG